MDFLAARGNIASSGEFDPSHVPRGPAQPALGSAEPPALGCCP